MLIKNVGLLYGKELEYLPQTNLRISGKYINEIGKKIDPRNGERIFDCEGLLMIPGFINSHTHIADSIGKDIGIDAAVDQKIHPVGGFKQKILRNSEKSHLKSFIKNSCISMIKKGITTFVDFREGGIEGIHILKDATKTLPIRPIILGRVEYYQDIKSIKKNLPFPSQKKLELVDVIKNSQGIGISGPNEFSDSVLRYFGKTKKIRAIHSAETQESNTYSEKMMGTTETQRALISKPNFLVHMTFASKKDLSLVKKNNTSIVVCPRVNGSLAEGIVDIDLMQRSGCNVAIGTDNVMTNSPDMFRELDYLWKVTMAIKKARIPPRTILKMASSNASSFLGDKFGYLKKGNLADCLLIEKHSLDLEPMHNVYASLVHRASENTIRAVIFEGKIAHGKI